MNGRRISSHFSWKNIKKSYQSLDNLTPDELETIHQIKRNLLKNWALASGYFLCFSGPLMCLYVTSLLPVVTNQKVHDKYYLFNFKQFSATLLVFF